MPSISLHAFLAHLFILTFAAAQRHAVFTYGTDAGPQFTWAVNAVDNGDLYFHMSGPSQYSWMAVGIGEEMDDNLMFIAYPSGEGESMTLSPRVAFDGTSEPTYYPHVRCETKSGSFERNGDTESTLSVMSIDAVCRNATSWDGGSLDLSSASQVFMFAFGPDRYLPSKSLDAPLLRHQLYGNFNMDMTKAASTGSGTVPEPNGNDQSYVQVNASEADDVESDGDYFGLIHGVVACVAYVGLYPSGSLLLRLSHKIPVRLHWVCQSIASVVVLVGFGLAIAASGQYNRSRDYSSTHQVIGLVLLATVVVQLVLGAVNHVIYQKKGKPTTVGKLHLVVGPLIVLLAMANGGLGLELAMASTASIIAYSVTIAVFAVALVAVRLWITQKRRTHGLHAETKSQDNIPLNDHGRGRSEIRD